MSLSYYLYMPGQIVAMEAVEYERPAFRQAPCRSASLPALHQPAVDTATLPVARDRAGSRGVPLAGSLAAEV